MSGKTRVCIVGAGPSGMSALYHFAQMDDANAPEVTCFEKQSTWSGLWNYTWHTGTDAFGEPCHASMYHNLWINAPKECNEFPDYTLDRHFGRAIPSYVPRKVLRDYNEGRWKSCAKDLTQFIAFNTVVQRVEYNKDTDEITVTVRHLKEDRESQAIFTHVIVAAGIFSLPNLPDYPGLDEFPGQVIHSHKFRDAREYKGKKLLLLGARWSAEDIALQCKKFGADHIIFCWRTKPLGFKFPDGIEERPLLQKVDGNTAIFRDGSTADVDVIILCTGYLCSYPFLADDLRLQTPPSMYPDHLYKGTMFLNGGNNKLLYLGTQAQLFSFCMFDVQAVWACKYIAGDLKIPPKDEMDADVDKWRRRVSTVENHHEAIDFLADCIEDLSSATGYNKDAAKSREMFHEWLNDNAENAATYRDQSNR